MNSPVRVGVSPTATTATGFFSQKICGFISSCWNSGLCGLSHSPVAPPSLCPCTCWNAWSVSHHLVTHSLGLRCLSLLLLPAWMNVSSLTPWLSDSHIVLFSGSSGCFCFKIGCCPFGCEKKLNISTYTSILDGSLTTKVLKKKHSSRLVEEVETGNWSREEAHQGSG